MSATTREQQCIQDVSAKLLKIGIDPNNFPESELHYGTLRRCQEKHTNTLVESIVRSYDADELQRVQDDINEYLGKLSDWSFEYNTTHDDAGNSYAFLVAENPTNAERVFREYCREEMRISLTNEQLSDLLQNVLDLFEMKPGYYSSLPGCCLDSYSVGEIEEQFEISNLLETVEMPDDWDAKAILHWHAENNHEHCLRYDYKMSWDCAEIYVNAEGHFWGAVLEDETIREHATEFILETIRRESK